MWEESTRTLIRLIGQRAVQCEGTQRDRYKRPLVRCIVGQVDLGHEMVRSGWAVAEFGPGDYEREEETAWAAGVGAWAGSFERPREYRK
jgi:endonuclease YncB( thermonuclease family)